MCNCISEKGEAIKAILSGEISEGGELAEYETGWENSLFSISDSKFVSTMKYKLAYRAKKKNGEMYKNLTRLEANIRMAYCPFCGEKQD
ncbi:hypothetical protein J0A78_05390 [Providencia rettgeri]|uniref:hypothetical protein n=1 Tax=Providencia rettgeri TaxID=587 RepID=UPI0019D49D48|nr:hypothetical protein [Providencia rettgeri]MBN7840898.1 hypothetical protein [Providencia rettgeri]MBN7855744.1 hypothetical protein [Providencia rettgeri]MBN7860981.1 hypothetical protein [Providencia rettgeri]MBN7874028.1 hypothetical protein [Providencia rettgeri]MBN7898207.1 hypothetical protein [Providencia rettgeri]